MFGRGDITITSLLTQYWDGRETLSISLSIPNPSILEDPIRDRDRDRDRDSIVLVVVRKPTLYLF